MGDAASVPGGAVFIFGNDNVLINNGSITAGSDTGGGLIFAIQSFGDNTTVVNNNMIVVGNGDGFGFPSAFGVAVQSLGSVVNNGTIIAGNSAVAILVCCNNTVTNAAGALIQVGDDSLGIVGSSDNVITNAGRIVVGSVVSGGALQATGIYVSGDNNTIVNSGSIVVGSDGTFGIYAIDGIANIVTNSGLISGGNFSVGVGIADDGSVFTNTRTGIIAVGNDSYGVVVSAVGFSSGALVENYGTISVGANSVGILIDGGFGHTINNYGLIVAGADGFGVQFDGDGTLNNFGTIRALGGTATAISNCACTSAVVINSGTIDGIVFLDNGGTITNSGLITITATDASMLVGARPHLGGDAFVQTASGTLAVRVTGDGRNDSLGTAAGGSVTLDGTLRVMVQPGLYQPTTTYINVVTASVPITGQFANHVSSSPFFTVTADYTPGDAVHITLSRTSFNAVLNLTPNQQAVANALEAGYATTLTGNAATFYGNLLAATSVGVLDQISGQGLSGAQHVGFGSAGQFNSGMMQQGLTGGSTSVTFPPLGYAAEPARPRVPDAFAALDANPAMAPGRTRLWTSVFGITRTLDGEASSGATGQTQRSAGGMFGIDRQITPDLLAGLAVGGSEGGFATDLSTSGRMTGGHIGAYATQSWGSAYLAGAVSYARFAVSTTRTITGIGPTETATGSTSADILAGRFEFGWKQRIAGMSVTPFVAIEPAMLWQQGYAETSVTSTGAPGVLGLSLASRSTSSLPASLGVQIDSVQLLSGGRTLAPFARASWVHEFMADRPVAAALLAVPAASFTVAGASAARDAARLDAGARLVLGNGVTLSASATGEFSDRSRSYGATASLRANW